MSWFTHVPMNWTGFTYADERQSYRNLFLQFFILLFFLIYSIVSLLFFITYSLSFVAYIYKKINHVPDDIQSNSWDKIRHSVSCCFIKFASIVYGHEIIGMEHLPEGPAIIVYYHGTIDIDYIFVFCKLFVQKKRKCVSVADKGLFDIPGMQTLFQLAGCMPGSKAECVEMLKKGFLLGIAPGGAREMFFSDKNYKLLWGKRTGFAQVALEAKVPIIPMFTQNIQEAFRGCGRSRLMRRIYEKTRRICPPIYGCFPVKLRTYLGEPIPYDPTITAVELAAKTKAAIEKLRDQHQKLPGNVLRAFKERFDKHPKDD